MSKETSDFVVALGKEPRPQIGSPDGIDFVELHLAPQIELGRRQPEREREQERQQPQGCFDHAADGRRFFLGRHVMPVTAQSVPAFYT